MSRLIDVVHDRDPAHGKLHIGLYITAFQDAIDRAAQLREAEMSHATAPSFTSPSAPKLTKRQVEDERGTIRAKNARRKVASSDHSDRGTDITPRQDENHVSVMRTGIKTISPGQIDVISRSRPPQPRTGSYSV